MPRGLPEVDGGTFILKEPAELSAALQIRLVESVVQGGFRPRGRRTFYPTRIRVVLLTRDLAELHPALDALADSAVLAIPPLRERPEDIPELARRFSTRASERYGRPPLTLPDEEWQVLAAHAWPGNARQLERFVGYVIAAVDPLPANGAALSLCLREYRLRGQQEAEARERAAPRPPA